MKPTVAKYTCSRIEDMVSEKILEVDKEYKIPNKSLSNRERFDLIVNGDVDFRYDFLARGRCYPSENISKVYDFSEYESWNKFREGHKEARNEVYRKANEIKDQVWLGSEEDAMRLLKEFQDY